MKKEPVAFLLPSLAHGGAQKVFLEIAGYLAGRDQRVVLVSLDRDGELLGRIPENLDVVFLDDDLTKIQLFKRLIQFYRLHRFIKESGIDRVFSTITGMNIFTLMCFYFSRKTKIVIREASTLENCSSSLMKMLVRILYPRANNVICTSDYIKSEIVQWGRVEANNVVVLPNPIDMERIRFYSKLSENIKPLSNSGQYRIVAVGRLVTAKGFDILLDALDVVRKDHDVHLVIVGEGPERKRLEERVKYLGLELAVSLVGYQENPYPYILNSDLFVLSSRWEGYVNVLIEAMVLGIDVVVTDCNSGPGKLLKEKLNYCLVPVESVEALAKAICDALQNPRDTSKFEELLEPHQLQYAINRYFGEENVV